MRISPLAITAIAVMTPHTSAQTLPPPTTQYAQCPVDANYDCSLCTDVECTTFNCRLERFKCWWHSSVVNFSSNWIENRCRKEENTDSEAGKLAAAIELLLQTPYFTSEEIDSVEFLFCTNVVSRTAITISESKVLLSVEIGLVEVEELAAVLAHELWHIRQYADLGTSHFRCLYANELAVGNGLAQGNCLEDPAYAFGTKVYKCLTDGDCDDP